jgi:nuclear pore complex protein Nup54
MSSLFGNTNTQSSGGGLFGGTTQSSNPGGGLFGNTNTQNANQGGGLFGGGANTQNTGTSLFGNNAAANQTQGGGLFGSTNNAQQQPANGLFSRINTSQPQQQQSGTGLFGATTTQPAQPGTSLFGGTTTQPQQQQTGTGLFGATTTQPAQPATGLFGATIAQQQQAGTGLFGATNTQSQQQQPGTGLFGAQQPQSQTSNLFPAQQQAMPNPNGSLFPQTTPYRTPAAQTFSNPQQTHLSSLLQSGLGNNPSAFGSIGLASQADMARSRLATTGYYATPANEKTVLEQIQTLVRKWDPQSQDTLMQKYLYNAVNGTMAPFFYRNPEENEKDWEEALSKKPAPVHSKDGETAFVPILVRGFHALSERVKVQERTLNALRLRLHEMNDSLSTIMATHQQSLTVRLENARRQHTALEQRAMRVAVKAQVLKNRGYPLDRAEEVLRQTLMKLEGQVSDPRYAAREEEVWARMVALRDRARWLEEEGRRIADQNLPTGAGEGGQSEIGEEVIQKTRKILADYDGQIRHLGKELEEIRKEFQAWEEERR